MKKKILAAALLLTMGLAGCSAKGQSVQTDYIGEDEARTTALTASGVAQDSAQFTKTQLETDDGKTYYDVEFTDANGTRYEYDIDAMTGAVIAYESKGGTTADSATTQNGQTTTGTTGEIDEATAKQTALDDAGLTADQVTFVKVERDRDDGVNKYEIEFYAKDTNTEYDYEINAQTGAIIGMDTDAENYTPQTGGLVSEQTVKQTVLAKVPGATEDNLRIRLESDDGREQYEGTIVYDEMKYEFEVDAYSGAIREWDAESVYD